MKLKVETYGKFFHFLYSMYHYCNEKESYYKQKLIAAFKI